MIINNYNFEIYLEGYLVPGVLFFTIEETSDNITNAVLTLTGTTGALKLLAGTIIQIFGNTPSSKHNDLKLLYEGEVTQVQYQQSSDTGNTINIMTRSSTSQFYLSRIRPIDAVVNRLVTDATGLSNTVTIFKNSNIIKYSASTANSPTNDLLNKYSTITTTTNSGLKQIFTEASMNFIQALGNDTPGQKGNFFPFMKAVNSMFMQSDIIYGINTKSLYLFDSLFLFPNPNLPYFFQVKEMLEGLNKLTSELAIKYGSDAVISVANFFSEFKNKLYYRSIMPAAPTASNLFFSDDSELNISFKSPVREYYIPGIESGPPALTNIIFPHEILSMNYTHDLANELTRLIVTGNIGVINNNTPSAILPTVVSPEVPYIKHGEDPNTIIYTGFTDEELYRGVNLKKMNIDGVLNKILVEHLQSPGATNKPILNSKDVNNLLMGDENNLSTGLSITADRYYITNKFSTRMVSVTTNWNPNYVVGLPGLIIINDNLSFTGIVEKVSHRCSSDGSISTVINFSSCRHLFLNEDDYGVNNPLADSLLVPETESPIYGGLGYAYNEKLYSFEKMGEFLYSYIITGVFNKKLFNSLNIENKDSYWQEFTGIPDSLGDISDKSILYNIKDSDSNILQSVTDVINSYEDIHGPAAEEIKNSLYLKESIKILMKQYKAIASQQSSIGDINNTLEAFTNNIKYRNIISKIDYLEFLGANNQAVFNKVSDDDTKDLISIVNKTFKGDIMFLKERLLNMKKPKMSTAKIIDIQEKISSLQIELDKANSDIKVYMPLTFSPKQKIELFDDFKKRGIDGLVTSLINKSIEIEDELNKYKKALEDMSNKFNKADTYSYDDVESILKPYNRTRKAHVIEAFKDYSSVYNVLVKEN